MESLVNNESTIRVSVFVGVFILMALLELLLPKKARTMPRLHRWATNISLIVIGSIALRWVTPILAVGMASWALVNNVGLFNWVELPAFVEVVLAILLLDMLIYIQHFASHKFSILWLFHKVHHSDRDIDVTTGARFHPLEIVLSMFFKLAAVLVIGPSMVAVILFEILLNVWAMFNHSNLALTRALERVLRLFVVTPDFHRVHHSVIISETDSNYGFFLSIWDRIFKTYIAQPRDTHAGMTIGLTEHQTDQPNTLWWSLMAPFKGADEKTEGCTEHE